jgi:nucleoside transporter
VRVLKTIRKAEYAELIGLFFVQGASLGMWLVPLGAVLDAHGLGVVKPYAYAATAVAAFVSPLIFGAMADRHASPVKVLRGLALATAAAMTLATTGIKLGWNPWLVFASILFQALCASPTTSLSSAIVFAGLSDSQKEFGPIRAMMTSGWVVGCWIISALGADTSAAAGYIGVLAWLVLAGFTFFLPDVPPPKSAENLKLRQRMGWDALTLLKNPDHRVVFLTAALFNIPLAALLPFTPPHLEELGLHHVTAWMTLAQATEIIAMFLLGKLLAGWRLKWIFTLGLGLGLIRYALCALNSRMGLLVGTTLHGAAFTLVLITSQIYLDQRVDAQWRARAQALMYLMTNGAGNLFGFLGTGWWFNDCTGRGGTNWSLFWGGLAGMVALVLAYFLAAYRGIGAGPKRGETI